MNERTQVAVKTLSEAYHVPEEIILEAAVTLMVSYDRESVKGLIKWVHDNATGVNLPSPN